MRSFALLAMTVFLTLPTLADTPQWQPGTRETEARALEQSRRNNESEIDRIARREYNRGRSQRVSRKKNYCWSSFWTKSEALRLCPPATAMKVRQDGEVFYYCDCSN